MHICSVSFANLQTAHRKAFCYAHKTYKLGEKCLASNGIIIDDASCQSCAGEVHPKTAMLSTFLAKLQTEVPKLNCPGFYSLVIGMYNIWPIKILIDRFLQVALEFHINIRPSMSTRLRGL